MSNEAWIIDACRTPRGIGKAGKGALSGIHPQQLGATVLRALAERNAIRTEEVDDIVWGTSSQRGQQSGDLGRMAALDAGYDVRSSAVTLAPTGHSHARRSGTSATVPVAPSARQSLLLASGTTGLSSTVTVPSAW